MQDHNPLSHFLDELASSSPAPGGGSVAALAGALGAALTSMVCQLTIGKKKYVEVEPDMQSVLTKSEELRQTFTRTVDQDAQAFRKVMEVYGLPKDTPDQKALRTAAIQEATKEAALVPLRVMKYAIDALALARVVAEKGNLNSVSDAGVSALMLHAALEGAALNVQINLQSITDMDFVGWHEKEVVSLQRTGAAQMQEVMKIVQGKIQPA